MTTQQHQAFRNLLQSWNAHQDVRTTEASIADLAASRAELDYARFQAARGLRRAA